jgi:hypothetical protein
MSSSIASSSRSWDDLQALSNALPIGAALNKEVDIRKGGNGSAHVQSKLRLFGSKTQPKITLYRDHAGECFRTVEILKNEYSTVHENEK